MEARKILIYFNRLCRGDFEMMYDKIKNKEPVGKNFESKVQDTIDTMSKSGYKTITLLDQEYPISLKAMPKPPMVIYASGDLSLLNCKGIGVLGDDEAFDMQVSKGSSILVFITGEEIELVDYANGRKLFIRLNMYGLPNEVEMSRLFSAFCKALVVYNAEDSDFNKTVVRMIAQSSFVPIKFAIEGNGIELFEMVYSNCKFTSLKELEEELKELEGDYEI